MNEKFAIQFFEGKKSEHVTPNSIPGGVQFVPLLDDLERQLGHTVISSERASDYIRPIEQQNADD